MELLAALKIRSTQNLQLRIAVHLFGSKRRHRSYLQTSQFPFHGRKVRVNALNFVLNLRRVYCCRGRNGEMLAVFIAESPPAPSSSESQCLPERWRKSEILPERELLWSLALESHRRSGIATLVLGEMPWRRSSCDKRKFSVSSLKFSLSRLATLAITTEIS